MGEAIDETAERGLGPDPAMVAEVLVVRPGGLGPVLKAVPALRHLRRLYPNARITVAVEPHARELLAGCPHMDRCTDLGEPAGLLLERYDVAISLADPEGAQSMRFRRADSIASVNARIHAAFRFAEERSTLAVHPVVPGRATEAARMLHLAWLLGGERRESGLALWPRVADRNAAGRLVTVAAQAPLAVLHMTPGSGDREWHPDGFARVVELLAAQGLVPVVVGTAADRDFVRRIEQLADAGLLDLTGQTPVGVLAGLMERAALFVGVDSGPAVLAGALGVRSVVIGPASALEQIGRAGRVTHVLVDGVGDDLSPGQQLPAAHGVSREAVLGAVTLAAHQAVREWRRSSSL